MEVIKFWVENWDSLLVVVAFCLICIALVKRGQTKKLQTILFNLVTQAEREFGSGTGKLKFAAVSDWVYQRLPLILKVLFTQEDIDKMIESALEEAKKQWGANKNLQEVVAVGDAARKFVLCTDIPSEADALPKI